MTRSYIKTRRVATGAVLTALALIFSYIEFLIPLPIGIPGIKLGLANLIIVVCLYKLGIRYAYLINFARVVLAALMFGSAFSALYALSGAFFSLTCMVLLKRCGLFSAVGISMAGGVFHNVGQLLVAALLMQNGEVFLYLPVLLISGMLTGIINGILAIIIFRSLK